MRKKHLSAIAEAYTVPQWDDNARVTELANTLTALTLAGVPAQDTSMKYVVISLRRIVTVTNSPAEAAVDFFYGSEKTSPTSSL